MRLCVVSFILLMLCLSNHAYAQQITERHDKLDTIQLSQRFTNADSLMSRVNKTYDKNHNVSTLQLTFKHENSIIIKPSEVAIKLEKSPSSKARKKELNVNLAAFASQLKSKPVKEYEQHFGDFVGNIQYGQSLNLKEAYRFVNYEHYTTVKELIPNLKKALGDELSQDVDYKIRSGIFPIDKSLRLVIDTSNTQTYKDKNGVIKTFTRDMRSGVLIDLNRLVQGNLYDNNDRNAILNTDMYSYLIEDFVQTDSTQYYVVRFKPKSRKADYEGIAHIDSSDFGLLQLQYGYAKGKHGQKVNLKLLLGVKFNAPFFKETISFKKHESGVYYPEYIKRDKQSYMFVRRNFQLKNLKTKEKYRFDFMSDNQILEYEILTVSDASLHNYDKQKHMDLKGIKTYTIINSQ